MTQAKIRASDLRELLQLRYPAPEYTLLEEVRNGTGYTRVEGYADALAMSNYPSRGIYLSGFEIKVSKSDLKSEMSNPNKAERFAQYCTYWYLVCPQEILTGEEPPNWGILIPTKKRDKLQLFRKAQELTPIDPPLIFWASLLRNAASTATKEITHTTQVLRDTIYNEVEAASEQHHKKILERVQQAHDNLRAEVARFSKATGVLLNQWGHNTDHAIKYYRLAEKLSGYDLNVNANRLQHLHQDIRGRTESYLESLKSYADILQGFADEEK